MKRARKPSRPRPEESERVVIGVEVQNPTPEQVKVLRKIFQLTAVATLGLPQVVAESTRQQNGRKRRPRA